MKNVLIVAAHADDECLGAGGAMAKHVENGDTVNVLILCPNRSEMGIQANKILGVTGFRWLNLRDQEFDAYPLSGITQSIESYIDEVKPNIVFTHWHQDLNLDHTLTARATLTACRPLPGSSIEAVYGFEIPSSTEWGMQPFMPTHYEELDTHHVDKKMSALQCYGDEMKPRPHARSMHAISSQINKRGYEVGVTNAEAFHVYRTIKRIL